MKAVFITEFGTGVNVELRNVPEPSLPTADSVLIRVRAAGLNRADLLQRRGAYPPPPGFSPNIPGLEFAGDVEAVGPGAGAWKIGDRVFGITAGEGQSEYLLISAQHLARIPDNLSFVEAAAVPEVFITAYDAIFTRGQLMKGETLLIHAVGSGVGLAALQLAKVAGAKVMGTSRTADKLARCRKLGIDHEILLGPAPEFAAGIDQFTEGRGINVILDLVGAAYFEENLRSLASKGRLILVGLTSGRDAKFNLGLALQKRATIVGTVLRSRSAEEKAEVTQRFTNDVLPLLNSGQVTPNVDKIFPAADVIAAYNYLESNVNFGKIVLQF